MYLTFEEQPSVLKKQFAKVGITNQDPIMIHTGAVFDDRALEDLKEAIIDFSPTLVILDTIFDISQLETINDYKGVKDALSKIRAIARETNSHILGVHHTNKMGGFMGSQAIFGAVDTMITFVQQRDRRYLFSSGKHGEHFDDQEIIFNAVNETYTLGRPGSAKKEKL
jgi:predicted ATP-dependent serine protease